MTIRAIIDGIVQQEEMNFLLTNAVPRRLATRLVGWFSHIERPLVRNVSLGVWRLFSRLDLSDAEQTHYRSLHDCFTRRLRPGARPFAPDPAVLASPCDAIIGTCGVISDGMLLQVKGRAYPLADLLDDASQAADLADSVYVTLRLTSAMYHHFHAPLDCSVTSVTHIFGDVWNVNPATLKRVDRLFCRNERAVITARLSNGPCLTLVAVAAILVAGIRLTFVDMPTGAVRKRRWRTGCDVALRKGEEMGWFEHGSTIIVIAPRGFSLGEATREGVAIRAGEPLLRLTPGAS